MTLEDLLDPCGRLIAAGIWLTLLLGAVVLTVVNARTNYINAFG